MPPPDKRRPFPDKAHEDLATWVEETVASIKQTRADVDDSFLLADTLFGLVDTNRGNGQQHRSDIDDSLLLVDVLFGLVDELLARVAALEARLTVLPGPDAAG